MSDKTATNLFMFSPLTEYAGFYQELIKGISGYQSLGNRLIQLGEQAHAFRQFDKVKEIGQILSNLPVKHYQAIGNYYMAVAFNRCGNGDMDKAQRLFELAVDTAPPQYRAKAILSLAAVSAHKKDTDSELYYFVESLKASCDFSTHLIALRGIAVHKAREGFHKQALNDLERTLTLAKYASPHIYFDYLNAVAVELGEAGRKDEARDMIKHVVASPFAPAYPEWQETARDLQEPNRSFGAFRPVQHKLVEVKPQVDHRASTEAQPEPPTKVLDFPPSVVPFPPLKEAPRPNKPKRLKSQEAEYMNIADKKEYIMAAIKSGAIPESEYKRMMYLLGLVESGPAEQIIDLEDDALLDSIIMNWCNLIEPEQFVAVVSALRDCKDDLRRKAIMDNMITIAYQQTASNTDSESEWRKKVECRLPAK